MSVPIIYVAGPYRAETIIGIRLNIERASVAAMWIWAFGAVAVCPHMNSAFFDGIAEDELFLEGYVELLKRCDAVYVLPGSQNSKGTLAEIQAAKEAGIPVFDGDTSTIVAWMKEKKR